VLSSAARKVRLLSQAGLVTPNRRRGHAAGDAAADCAGTGDVAREDGGDAGGVSAMFLGGGQ